MVSRDRGSGGLDRGVEAVGWRVRASIITDKLPSFYLASCFPLVKYSVILLLTVSNIVTNVSDLSIGFVGLVLCLRGGGDASSVGRASRV